MFRALRAELPYVVAVTLAHWHDCRDGAVRVGVELTVPRPSARAVVVGAGGAVVGAIGIAARTELERLLGRRVHLDVRVKVANRGGGG